MALRELWAETMHATGFLTRYRLPARYFEGHDGRLDKAAAMFPAAGLAAAAPSALLIFIMAMNGANAALTALIAMAILIGVTGALHEDGLADTADAFGAGGNRERMLSIMKDSRIGTYGVLALIVSFSLRAISLTILLAVMTPFGSAILFLAAAALSRAAMVWHWNALPPARENGVAVRAGTPAPGGAEIALVTGAALFAVSAVVFAGVLPAISAIVLAALATSTMTRLARAKIGGQTGDTIGAAGHTAETALLLGLALVL